MLNDPYVELAELAGSFIHEIKNHLSTLGLNLQLLAEDFQDPQSQRERRAVERVHRLQAECQRLVGLANDFLRFARVKDLDLKPTRVSVLLEEMVDFFSPTARQANIDIKCYIPADLPLVALDGDLFKQALLNLMLNAEQAMPSGGELTIQAEKIADCGLRLAGSSQAASGTPPSAIELSLIDTGQGMSPEVLANVFRPFFSTKPAGSGLGLPTVRRIIQAHGGKIDVQSEVGRGTKFAIRLPALE
jgi:two-component system, NtrC family, sensor histidine kinase HydH